jgi:surfactin synthase thioesterase subunit
VGRLDRRRARERTLTAQAYVCFAARPEATVNLICLPWVGSGAAPFHPWQAWLPPQVELFAVRLAGRESRLRQLPADRVETAVGELVDGLSELPTRPYVLFGHCLGALIGYEMSREVRRRAMAPPERLILAASPPPTAFTAGRTQPALSDEVVAQQAVIADPRMAELLRPGIEADLRMGRAYVHRPGVPLDVPITLLRAIDEPVDMLARTGWAQVSTGRIALRTVAGGRLFPDGAWRAVCDAVAAELAPLLAG